MGAQAAGPIVGKLLERERELERIDAALASACAGDGAAILIEGEPGIGKTSLLDAACTRGRDAGMSVGRATGSELEREFVFGVGREMLGALASLDDAALFHGAARQARPVLEADPALDELASEPESRLHGLYWLISALAERAPLLLAIDDWQWADEASARFTAYLARRIEGLGACLLVGSRTPEREEREVLLSELVSAPALEVLRPARLSGIGVASLIGEITGDGVEADFEAAARAHTAGNPFMVAELASALKDEGVTPTAAHSDRIGELRPRNLWRALIARLPQPDRDVAAAIAILEADAEPELVAELSSVSKAVVREAANRLIRVGLLVDQRPFAFVHPIIQAVAMATLTEPERARAHSVAARVLRDMGAPIERVAVHLLRAEPEGDTWAVEVLRDAAARASVRGSPTTAAGLLRRALEEPPSGSERTKVLIALGTAERQMGAVEAIEHLTEAVRTGADLAMRADAARLLPAAVGQDPRGQERILPLLDSVLEDRADLDPETVLHLEAGRLPALLLAPERHAELRVEVERHQGLPGRTPAERVLLSWLARLGWAGATAQEIGKIAERAASNPFEVLPSEGPGSIWVVNCTLALRAAERLGVASAFLDEVIEFARREGAAGGYTMASLMRATVRNQSGDLLGAEADARTALESGAGQEPAWYPFISLLDSLRMQGRSSEGAEILQGAGCDREIPTGRVATAFAVARGALRSSLGRDSEALADLDEALERLERGGSGGVIGLDARLERALVLKRLGQEEAAVDAAQDALDRARRFEGDGAVGGALRVLGLIGERERALERLRDAESHLGRTQLRYDYALALVDLGATLRRRQRRRECREYLRQGESLAEGCGARGLADRAREELAASGITMKRRDPTEPERLTASERRICLLAAAGKNNPEIAQDLFVTRKTVEMHLSNSYRKLEINSRSELAETLDLEPERETRGFANGRPS